MKTYLIKVYCNDLDNKVKEFVFKCKEEEIEEFTRKEVETFEKVYNRKATDVIIFEKIKDYK